MCPLFDAEATIIKNEEPLTEAFIPERMYHRDGERGVIVSCIAPAAHGRTPRNMFIFGPTGSGKTSLVQWVLGELSKESRSVKTAYINCWKNPSTHAILSKLVSDLASSGAKIFSNPKKQSSEILADIEAYVQNQGKKLVVVLDEIDRVEDMDVLYSMSRNNYGIICISNDPHALANLDVRIKSSLSPEHLEFPKYSVDEMRDILRERAEAAFVPGAIDDVFIRIAAAGSVGDARVGIATIHKAALSAEAEGARKITKEHILAAQKEARKLKSEQILSTLTEHHRVIYNILLAHGKILSSDLFEEYKKSTKEPVSERTYRAYMETLAALRLVLASGDVRWREYSII